MSLRIRKTKYPWGIGLSYSHTLMRYRMSFKTKIPGSKSGYFCFECSVLALSYSSPKGVPSPLKILTSVFGKGTGVPSSIKHQHTTLKYLILNFYHELRRERRVWRETKTDRWAISQLRSCSCMKQVSIHPAEFESPECWPSTLRFAEAPLREYMSHV